MDYNKLLDYFQSTLQPDECMKLVRCLHFLGHHYIFRFLQRQKLISTNLTNLWVFRIAIYLL